LSPQLINLIVQNTGLDRGKLKNEIDKIKSCFQDKKIKENQIELLLNIQTNVDFNNLRDEALNGNKVKTNRLLADTVIESENNVFYLSSINQRINKLNEIVNLIKNHSDIAPVVDKLKPPVFWKDKPVVISQSKKWDRMKLKLAMNKTYDAEIAIKSNGSIKKELIIKKLIIELCATANAS
jgi:DNA polymerase-3 subunit delta